MCSLLHCWSQWKKVFIYLFIYFKIRGLLGTSNAKVCLCDLMVCKSVSLLIPLMRCVSVVEMEHSMHSVVALPN